MSISPTVLLFALSTPVLLGCTALRAIGLRLRDDRLGYFAWACRFDASRNGAHLPDAATLRGIVVPHIDFTRGGPVEAVARSTY